MGTLRGFAILVCLLGLHTQAQAQGCAGAANAMLRADLHFGRAISSDDWAYYLANELSPRFPARFVVNANALGERGNVVSIVIGNDAASRARLSALLASYKTRFHRSAGVVLTRMPCVPF